MSQDQPPNSNPLPDDDLDDVWDSPTPDPSSASQASPSPSPRSSSQKPTTPQPTSRLTINPERVAQIVSQLQTGLNQAKTTLNTQFNQIRPELDNLSNKLRPALATAIDKLRPLLEKLQTWWSATLPKVRQVLPDSLKRSLSDRVLTNIAIGLLIIVLWSLPGILFGTPTRASQPSSQTPMNQPAPIVQPSPQPEIPITPTPVIPSPISNQPPSPPPPLDLTPAQSLIAAIQDQVAEVTNQYANGLIQSVQANFRSSRLIVVVGDEWYDLSSARQDTVAAEMQKRAKELGFTKLEITDAHETLLARSPVVGEVMLILQRAKGQVGSRE
ncbi:hypothetical protein H6G89_12005 [Oscillatoria sp. FACHB-1407]|uniref:hypothetical protein n=1 Tax=Oscillatoria sp. FACHB-1407 TaxID=2692847 RepID=UPI001685BE71|nr:hypothetical protein [Oscillatoria sp. FACHB-1407]MBD2461774.1 hypothetical protein [Oscillatoria sp. FACHB-1407]